MPPLRSCRRRCARLGATAVLLLALFGAAALLSAPSAADPAEHVSLGAPRRQLAPRGDGDDDGDDDGECGHVTDQPDSLQCGWVKTYCDSDGVIDYMRFRYCTLADAPGGAYVVMIAWLLVLISLLATTADNYFVPQLETMSAFLRLRPDVAGITLLALGNGAPDVFTAVAGIAGADDFDIVLSELLGASLFISSVVLGGVCLVANATVDKGAFLRDLLVYITSTCVIMAVALDGKISEFESLSFLGVYVIYVAIVVVYSYWGPQAQQRSSSTVGAAGYAARHSSDIGDGGRTSLVELPDQDEYAPLGGAHAEREAPPPLVGLAVPEDAGWFERGQIVVEWPFTVLRWLSTPSADEHWSRQRRVFAAFAPVGAPLVIMFDAMGPGGMWEGPWWVVVVAAGAAVGAAIFFFSDDDRLPRFHLALVVLAFASTVAWLDIIANEVVALLQALGLMLHVSSSILGLTVLALGNSVGDFVADLAVARAGEPKMAVASCFGSPLLNDLLGLGISLTMTTFGSGTLHVKVSPQIKLAYFFLFASLFSSLAVFVYNGYHGPPKYAYYLFTLYFVFMVLSCLVEAGLFL